MLWEEVTSILGMKSLCRVTVYHQALPLSPLVLYSGLPVRIVMSSRCTQYHVSAEPVVVSLQKLENTLASSTVVYKVECRLEKHEHRHSQAGPGLR